MIRIVMVLALALMTAQAAFATGEVALVDASGLEYFINTNITFTTTSSASGAASDATYTTVVSGVTTSQGNTFSTFLSDAFDGYNSLWVDVDSAGPVAYNQNGGAADSEGRELILPTQDVSGVDVRREVFAPNDDEFCRWLNVFTNTNDFSVSVAAYILSNLGSNGETIVFSTSDCDGVATVADNWIISYEDYIDGISRDPRLGHILQGPDAAVPLSSIFFETGDGLPEWSYTFNLEAGQTAIIMNFVTGQPNLAQAENQTLALAALLGSALDCMTDTELEQVVNFDIAVDGDGGGISCPFIASSAAPQPGGDVIVLSIMTIIMVFVHLRQRARSGVCVI